MNRLSALALAAMLSVMLSAPAFASTRYVTLAVPGMTCPSCPATLRVVLDRLPGVHVVGADPVHRTLKVDVSDSRVTDRDLIEATNNAGYPSSVVKNK